MSDFETELSDSLHSFEEKSTHFVQAGPLNEPSLNQLRDQIKKVMIPLLIKTFQFKLELSQSLNLPSRQQSQKEKQRPKEIIEQLRTLDNDLKVLLLWCQSCRSQIQKALCVSEEEQKNNVATSVPTTSNGAVSKSFNEAVLARSSLFKQKTLREKGKKSSSDLSQDSILKTWWRKFMGK
jgi:hypothetical protein